MLAFNFNPFPVLETNRIVLRRLTKKDAPNFLRLRNDDAIMEFINRPRQKDIAEIENFIELIDSFIDTNTDINWVIALKENDEMIGTMGFYRSQPENYRSEIGYMLDPAFWRKGIMSEAMKLAIGYGFNVMKLHTIEACINPNNIASKEILLKNGFVQEGYFKENIFWNGQFSDSEVFTLFNSTI
jgi:ribosomal-protein-alanine N-acetyltransferase